MKIIKPQSGIGLIEALIASVVFAIGIGAVLQLQSSFFKNSSAANARSIAMSIAQEKLEDLRSFKVKVKDDADTFDFAAITTDAGGSCTEQADDDICDVDLVAGNVTYSDAGIEKDYGDNIVFTRNWAVTDYYKDNTGELTTTANANGIVQKRVVVTISWTDTDNTAQTASLDTVINQSSGVSSSGLLAASGAGGSGEKPTVPHTELAAPDVIPTKLKTPPPREYAGDEPLTTPEGIADEYAKSGYCNVETFAATESPDPDLDTNPELNNVIVRFTSTKYQKYTPCSFNAPGDYTIEDVNNIKTKKFSDEEFLTVNCSCELAASGAGKDQFGESVTKALTGTKTGAANQQTDFCDLCCRDHHENTTGENVCNSGSSLENCYDPYRSAASNFTSSESDHKHYDNAVAVGVGVEYLEVCRMKRIDGFYNVIQDWKLIAHTTLVENELTDSSEFTSYQSYIGTTVNNYLNDDPLTTWNATAPDVPTNGTQMMSRSIYVDYMTAAEIAVAAPSGDTVDVLVPFYEYKTTQISDWTTTLTDGSGVAFDTGSPCSSANSANGACVDSPSITAIVTANANSIPDKGIYRYGSTPTADIKIVSTMTNSNSGVVAEDAIDPADNVSLSSGYTVAYGGTPPPVERSIQMTATELLACPNTWTGKSRSSIDIANWSAITLACDSEGSTTTSCDGYDDDQTVITVTPTMIDVTLGCTYAPNVGQKSCSTIQAATIPLLTGSLGCSVVLTKSGNNVECNLLCSQSGISP